MLQEDGGGSSRSRGIRGRVLWSWRWRWSFKYVLLKGRKKETPMFGLFLVTEEEKSKGLINQGRTYHRNT